ncbi:MAG: insulinase family protein [Actinobacteria bacterium]|nr:insulinase family protein [Actinomycetota bacterium]MCL5447485.1 insulinase family protein [Actinomycetota bacterium]
MIREDKIPGGLRLVTDDMPDARSVALGVFIGTGSRDEPDRLAGASHLLEHLIFKGTEQLSAKSIATAIDVMGGETNGFTSRELTYFYVRVLAEDVAEAAGILFSMLTEPALRESDLGAERTVVLDEIAMNLDSPHDVCAQRCQEALFAGHPLAGEVSGTMESVSSISSSDLREWFDAHYRSENIVVAAAGALDHDQLASLVARGFASRSGGGKPSRMPPADRQDIFAHQAKDTEQANMEMAMRGPTRHDENRWAADILDQVFGGSMSSRLFQEVREKRGLAYSIWSEVARYDDAGSFSISAGCAPEKLHEVIGIAKEMFEEVAAGGITDEEIDLAKKHVRSGLLLSLEHPASRMVRMGTSLLHYDRVMEVDELMSKISAVGPGDVTDVASALASRPWTLSVVGPFDESEFAGWQAAVR